MKNFRKKTNLHDGDGDGDNDLGFSMLLRRWDPGNRWRIWNRVDLCHDEKIRVTWNRQGYLRVLPKSQRDFSDSRRIFWYTGKIGGDRLRKSLRGRSQEELGRFYRGSRTERSPLRNVREEPHEEGEIQIKENVLQTVQEEEEEEQITKPIPSSVAQPETNLAQADPTEVITDFVEMENGLELANKSLEVGAKVLNEDVMEVDEDQVNMEETREKEGIDNDFQNLMGGEEKDKSLDGASGFAEDNYSIENVDQLKKGKKLWEQFVVMVFFVSLISSLSIFGFLFIFLFFIVGLSMLVISLSNMKYWNKNGFYAYYCRFFPLISDGTVWLFFNGAVSHWCLVFIWKLKGMIGVTWSCSDIKSRFVLVVSYGLLAAKQFLCLTSSTQLQRSSFGITTVREFSFIVTYFLALMTVLLWLCYYLVIPHKLHVQKSTDKVKEYMCLRSLWNYYIGLTSQVTSVSISLCIIVVVLWLLVVSLVIASLSVKIMHSNKNGLLGSYFSCIMAPLKRHLQWLAYFWQTISLTLTFRFFGHYLILWSILVLLLSLKHILHLVSLNQMQLKLGWEQTKCTHRFQGVYWFVIGRGDDDFSLSSGTRWLYVSLYFVSTERLFFFSPYHTRKANIEYTIWSRTQEVLAIFRLILAFVYIKISKVLIMVYTVLGVHSPIMILFSILGQRRHIPHSEPRQNSIFYININEIIGCLTWFRVCERFGITHYERERKWSARCGIGRGRKDLVHKLDKKRRRIWMQGQSGPHYVRLIMAQLSKHFIFFKRKY